MRNVIFCDKMILYYCYEMVPMKRKNIKKIARHNFKKHYIIFVLVCLISAFLGAEFSETLDNFRFLGTQSAAKGQYSYMSSIPFTTSSITDEFIYKRIDEFQKNYEETLRENEKQNWKIKTLEFGRQQGVLAQLINMNSSGSITVILMASVYSLIGSKGVASGIGIALVLIFVLLIWVFFVNTFSVVTRRFFLEGRIYKKVPINRFMFLFRNKNFIKAGVSLIVRDFFLLLWTLTIIGGFIKYYSYYMVPYILAENPRIGPLKALRLSKAMMKGRKWECFVYDLSFIGWRLLGALTLGIFNFLFTNPYYTATMTEYFVHIREIAKEQNLENAYLLRDKYLYQPACEESIKKKYADIIELKEMPEVKVEERNTLWQFISDFLGVIPSYDKKEQSYIQALERENKIKHFENILNGDEYPVRFIYRPKHSIRDKIESLHYLRHYSICSVILMFFVFSFMGWVWEVSFHLVTEGKFVNRGVLTGPWLPIYGYGCIMILLLLNKLKKRPVVMFCVAILLCGTVEYLTAVFLENMYNQQWWDYHGYFLNIDGKVCAEGLLVFGIGGMFVVYFVAPLIDTLVRKISLKVVIPICVILVMIFTCDQVYSITHPNTGKGITDQSAGTTVSQHTDT